MPKEIRKTIRFSKNEYDLIKEELEKSNVPIYQNLPENQF